MGCGMFLGGLSILIPVLISLLHHIPPIALRIISIIIGLIFLILVLVGIIGTCFFILEYRKYKKLEAKNGDEMTNQDYTSYGTVRTTHSRVSEPDLLDEPETRRNLERLEKSSGKR